MCESHLEPDPAQGHELGRGVVLDQGQVAATRPQVLANGQDVDLGLAQHAHGLNHLVPALAEAEHEPGLGGHWMTDLDRDPAAGGEDAHAPVPPGSPTDRALEARHRLDVVVQDFRLGLDHHPDIVRPAVQVGDEDLDARTGAGQADLTHGVGNDSGSTVWQVVAGDHGYDRMPEAHPQRRFGYSTGFVEIGLRWASGGDGAESAVPGADAAQDHERGGAHRPAPPLVRAAGLLADGVQRLVAHEPPEAGVRVTGAEPNLEPLRPATARSGVLRNGLAGAGKAAVEIRTAGIHHLRWSPRARHV